MTEREIVSSILSHLRYCAVAYVVSLLTNVSHIGSEKHINFTDAKIAKNFEEIKNINAVFYRSHSIYCYFN